MVKWDPGKRARTRFDQWLRDYPRLTPVAVFLFAILLTGFSAGSLEVASRESNNVTTSQKAVEIAAAIERQAAANSAYLNATATLFSSVDRISPEFFSNFVKGLQLKHDLSGVVGLGWSEVVPPERLSQVTKRMQESGYPDFAPFPEIKADSAGKKADLHIITMLEPKSIENNTVIGYNMHSEPRRAAAMDRAARSGTLEATDAIQLVQDAGKEPTTGFIAYVPVRSSNRAKRLKGFIYSPIRTRDFIEAAVGGRLLGSGNLSITDASVDTEDLIFAREVPAQSFGKVVTTTVNIFGQVWQIRYSAPRNRSLDSSTLMVLVGGVSFSLLLLAFILLVQRRNNELLALIEIQSERENERVGFVRELNHRVKNSLANVTSIISLTRRNANDLEEFTDTLLDRVHAMASSHSLLEGEDWGPTDLLELARKQLGSDPAFRDRIEISGSSVMIAPNDALTVGLALHELLTNANRYGALSNVEGKVRLSWTVSEGNVVKVDWQESGGPPVTDPPKRGFGLSLVERALEADLGRPSQIEFAPEGFHCRFEIPLRSAQTTV